nr:MAG TPA: pentapeptide repeat protein [Caudoviricetes sp.]
MKMKRIVAGTFRNHYISYDDFYHRIEEHRIWLLSQGSRGTRLKVMGLRIWCEIRDETLVNADFYCCDFSGARFIDCNFEQATFTNCTFRDNPKFSGNFRNASFNDCNLHTLDLSEAQNLEWANLDDDNAYYYLQCPEEGAFIGWKIGYVETGALGFHSYLIKLAIPADALRSSATSRKCRASKAQVLGIYHFSGALTEFMEARSGYDPKFVYKVGATIEIKDFDTNRWKECAPGIHFFMTRKEAMLYARI